MMNLTQANIVLRRRGALEIVDLALRVVRSLAPRETIRLMVWLVIPCSVICLSAWYFDVSWFLIWPAAFIVARFAELPFFVLVGTLLFDSEFTAKQAWRGAMRSFWRYAGGLCAYWLFLACGAVVVIGWFWVGGRYFYLPLVSVLEQARPRAALRRASQFVRHRESSVMQMLMVHILLRLSCVIFSEILGQACLEHVLDVHTQVDSLFEDGGSPFALLGLFLAVPYSAAFQFLAYTNERTIQDGWDIQVRFFGLSEHAEGGVRHAA
jgi:hypothetical protein